MQSLIACNPDCMHAISGICELLQTSKFGFSVNRISNLQVWHAISGLWQTLSLVAVSSRLASLVAVCLHRDGKYATLEFGPIQYESPIACNPKCIQGRIGTSAGRGRFSRSSPKWPNFVLKIRVRRRSSSSSTSEVRDLGRPRRIGA